MSDIPPTIEDDGESDYEQEPFGPENPLTYDEQISKPLDASDNLVWKPMGTDTDPLAFLPGGHREYLLPLPNRGDSIAGALPPEYGSKWPKPGHLFSKQVASHLESPMFKDDRLTLSDEGFKAIKAACEEMQKLVDLGYTAGKQLADGRLMLLKDEMTKMSKDPPKNEAPYESRLHQILAQSWEFALRRDDDLSNLSGGDVPPIPTHSTADLHHFESEYARLDEEGWPGSNSYIQEHARIRLKHSRLTKAEEKACIDMLAADKARIDNMGPPLILTPTPTEEPCWKAPAAKKHHRKYDEWTKEVAPLYLVPHINLQDLGNPDRLMQFITKRASASPMHFLQRDFRSTYLGRALRILTGPFSMHKASWPVLEDNAPLTNTDPTVMYHEYRLKEWERFRLCQVDTATLPVGDAWLGLKAQVITYRFYHRVCLFLLKDAGVKQAKPKADIAPFPGLSKDQKAEKSLIEKDTADANLYLEETSDGTGAGLLFSASFEEHRLEFSNDANTQLEAAVDHIDSLVTTPEYFHRHVQEAYDHHYAHLFPGLITGEDMKKELFVDVLRDVFRKPLMDVELSRYLQLGHDGLYPAVVYKETLFRESEQMLAQNQITFSEHREALETLNRWDSLHCYMLKYRGMMACMQYVSMITNRGIVPASKHLRKYYKRAPRFKAGLGKGNWISGSGVVRYLPKRGSEGRVMKKTRKLRRTMLNFPGLDIELSREGKEAVNTSETIRSIHMLLVEFLGHEELINAIGLGKLLRRINGLAENLRSDDEHCRLIRGPLEDLIQKMSVIFLLIERADAEVPHLANPISSAPDDCANLAKMREYFAHMNWIYPVPVVTRQALRKLDELPIENRVADEVISALFRQHQRWVARRGPANDDARGPGQVPRGVGSPKTASILLKFWCMLFDYVASEKALEDGSYTIRPDMSDLGPSLNETLAQAWPAISGTGSSALGRLGFLGGWGTHDDLYSHIRKPEYETFRKSLTHLTLEKFLEHASGSILDDPALSDVRVGRIKRHVDAYLKSIRGFKPEDTDRGLSSSFAAKDKEVVERWYLERKENCRLAPQNLILSVISGRIVSPLARDCNMEGELLESEDEEEEHGPGWAVGMGGEAGEEVEMEDSPNEEDPVVEDDSENEDEEMREDTGVEEPVVVDEVDDIAMSDAAESKDNVEAVDESIRDMHVDEQREPESAPEPALEPAAEPVPEPVPEPALEPVPEPVPEPAPEPAPKPAPEPAPELAPEPVPEPAPGTPPHPPGSNASTPSPERHRREAVQELENARYAWLQNLDDATWEEVRKKHGGFVDDTTSGRRTKREVPKKEREFYVQKSKPRDEPPPEEETAPKKGQLKRSVFSVIESIYRPTSGYRSAVTLVEMQDFMRAIGFPLRKLGGLEVRYTYDRAAGLIPHGRLARETFVVHQPHGSWGQVYNGPALDAMKKTLLDAGITYELITEFYEERGAGARPARGPVEGPA